MGDPLLSVVATSNREFYNLHGQYMFASKYSDMNPPLVVAVDVTVWARRLPDPEPQIYMEIRLDQIVVRATEAVKRNEMWSLNDKFQLYV